MDIAKCKQEIKYWKREALFNKNRLKAVTEMNSEEFFNSYIDNETEEHDEYFLYGIGLEFNVDLVENVRRSCIKKIITAIEQDEHLVEWYTNELINLLESEIADATQAHMKKELT